MSARQPPKGDTSERADRFLCVLSRFQGLLWDKNAKKPTTRMTYQAEPRSQFRPIQNQPPFCRLPAFSPRLFSAMLGVMLCLCIMPMLAQTAAPVAPPAAAPSRDLPAQPSTPSAGGQSPPKPGPLPPWQILTDGTADHNPARRAEAVAALGTIGPKTRVIHLLERALNDKDASVRQLAASTLGEMRARSSIPKLKEALNDESPEVSFAAAKSLWTMGDRTGREIFIDILSGEKSSSSGLVKGGLEATKKKSFWDPTRALTPCGSCRML